jgi:hypothetical protein
MNKIPVIEIIRFAYAFAFGGIGTIIGLVWLPTLLIGVLQFLPYALSAQVAEESSGAASAGSFLNFVCFLASLLLYAVNAVAVTQLALGKRPDGNVSLHLSVGRPEWRMLGGNLLCAVILGSLLMLYLLGLSFGASFARSGMPVPVALSLIVYALAGICALVYVALRLVPLVAPIVVAEDKLDLARGWALMAGNIGRMFAVQLAVSLPVLTVQAVATFIIGGPGLVARLPANPDAIVQAVNARMVMLDKHMPELIGLFLILAPFSLGLTMGAEAAAYRAIVAPKRNA